jgi:hypothetical protein
MKEGAVWSTSALRGPSGLLIISRFFLFFCVLLVIFVTVYPLPTPHQATADHDAISTRVCKLYSDKKDQPLHIKDIYFPRVSGMNESIDNVTGFGDHNLLLKTWTDGYVSNFQFSEMASDEPFSSISVFRKVWRMFLPFGP